MMIVYYPLPIEIAVYLKIYFQEIQNVNKINYSIMTYFMTQLYIIPTVCFAFDPLV